jgi:hypothetical protein
MPDFSLSPRNLRETASVAAFAVKVGRYPIASSRFRENTASSGAATAYLFNLDPWGSAFGGAIHAAGGSGSLDECSFETNSVLRGGVVGGVIPAHFDSGSGTYSGGAISVSNAVLACFRSTFATNQTFPGKGGGGGGAIYSAGPTWLSRCAFLGNRAVGIGGIYDTVDSRGGSLYSVSQLVIVDSCFAGNIVQGGGNVTYFGLGGRGSGIGSNGFGGAIFYQGDLRMTNTTLFANEARGGDGIVVNATNFGLAGLARGGAFFNAGGTAQLVNVTLANNGAFLGSGNPPTNNVAPVQGGGIFSTNGSVTLWNNIVANSPSGSNCFGVHIDGGHNLSSDGSCHFTAPGSLNNTDPLLGLLGDYGGQTPTVPLLIGSPALNAADSAYCPTTDQRGVARPYGAACDIGAFEWTPYLPNAFTVETVGPGVARLAFAGTPGQEYQLLISTNLPVWSLLATFTPDANGMFQYSVTNKGSAGCRFFKAVKR